ncbi:MAG TPA: hypothetical protein VD907_03160 [Verrucomicrobiae bacterium]|nr:hypothetical protein [Verrucomicrobiae bacterium]
MPQPSSASKKPLLVWIIVIAAIAVAGYLLFFLPKSQPANQPDEDNLPDFSAVKSAEIVLSDPTKTKAAYQLPQNSVKKLSPAEQNQQTVTLTSGSLVPLEKLTIEKHEANKKIIGVEFTVYQLKDGLENTSLIDIFQQQDDAKKAEVEAKDQLLTHVQSGTPPSLTIQTTDNQAAPLASIKRTTIITKDSNETAAYEILSGLKTGKNLLVAHFTTDSETRLLQADSIFQDLLNQVRLKTQ